MMFDYRKKIISNTFVSTIFAFLLISTGSLQAQNLKYYEQSGDMEYDYYYSFNKIAKGYEIHVARMNNGDTLDKQVLITNNDYETLSWWYFRFGEHTEVLAQLTREGVHIKGYLDDDELDEMEELDDDEFWIQLFPLNPGFEKFIFSDEEEIVFWSIGTESPADMELHSFSAEKVFTGYSDEFKCNIIQVNFSPTGWKSFFWDGDYYFRQDDGRLMGYRGDGAPGKPSSKTTLVEENK